jgi:hypothetical protein
MQKSLPENKPTKTKTKKPKGINPLFIFALLTGISPSKIFMSLKNALLQSPRISLSRTSSYCNCLENTLHHTKEQ